MENKDNNKKMNEEELEVSYKGATIAAVTMLILACIYYCYEIFTGRGSNPGFYSLITIYSTILFGYKGIKIEKNRKLNIFTSIIWGILTIMLVFSYFRK